MWLRLARYYRGYCQKVPLVYYRRHHRKSIPMGKLHRKIRQNAYKLYQWNNVSLLRKKKKHRIRGLSYRPNKALRIAHNKKKKGGMVREKK
ncbi:hypothetical protein D3C76_1622770 [compost metagenome]